MSDYARDRAVAETWIVLRTERDSLRQRLDAAEREVERLRGLLRRARHCFVGDRDADGNLELLTPLLPEIDAALEVRADG